jgi:hypothetical protein
VKPVKDETLDVVEEAAREGAKQILAYFKYQGDNPTYYNKGKLGAIAISGFGRVRASETNRMAMHHKATKGGGK